MTTPHTHQSTRRRLDFNSFPMRLFQKAKVHGIWDPQDLDFSQDKEDWQTLSAEEQDALLHLTAIFLGGEESVTLDLMPLLMTVAEEGRLEEEMYLTSFLWEEAKHIEAFRKFLDEVTGTDHDLSSYYGSAYEQIIQEELPKSLSRLMHDRSPEAQAQASVTYNMIVEGMLAETGYYAYLSVLEKRDIMPGLQTLILNLNRDESRHIAFGIYFLSRLVETHGDPVWDAIQERMGELLLLSVRFIIELFDRYDEMPFGLDTATLMLYALNQFNKRYRRLVKARQRHHQRNQSAAVLPWRLVSNSLPGKLLSRLTGREAA